MRSANMAQPSRGRVLRGISSRLLHSLPAHYGGSGQVRVEPVEHVALPPRCTSRFAPGRRSNSSRDWPGQRSSPSGSTHEQRRPHARRARSPAGSGRRRRTGRSASPRAARTGAACSSSLTVRAGESSSSTRSARSKALASPRCRSARRRRGSCAAHGAPRSTMPGSTAAAAKRCSKASARGTSRPAWPAADHGEPAGVDVRAREHRVDDRRQHVLPVRPRREPLLDQRGLLPRPVERHPVVAALGGRRAAERPRRGRRLVAAAVDDDERARLARRGAGARKKNAGNVVPS